MSQNTSREKNREFCSFPSLRGNYCAQSASEFSGLQQNSLRNGTGNFLEPNREFAAKNREFLQEMLDSEFLRGHPRITEVPRRDLSARLCGKCALSFEMLPLASIKLKPNNAREAAIMKPSLLCQFCQGSIIPTRGYDSREGQPGIARSALPLEASPMHDSDRPALRLGPLHFALGTLGSAQRRQL